MRKLLIINRLGIGDVVLSTPLAKVIKDSIEAQVGYVVANKAVDLLNNHHYIDDCFGYDKKIKKKIIGEIKLKGYNEALILDGRMTSMLIAHQAGCKLLNYGFEITIAKKKIFSRIERLHWAMDDFCSYCQVLGIPFNYGQLKATIGKCDEGRKKIIKEWLDEIRQRSSKIVLVVCKTAANNKNWSIKHLEELNQYLNSYGVIPIYTGSSSDYEYIESIGGEKVNAAGKFGLRDLPQLAESASFAVSMCTGPLHVLATTDIPIIAIYGPTDPNRWAPKTAIVVQSTLPCVPCNRWTDCIKPKGSTCMDDISSERIKNIIEDRGFLE